MGATCAACGRTNRDGARFCAACGSRLTQRCSGCGEELPEGARFCDACGAPVGTVAGGPPAPVAPGELPDDAAGARKFVTVLFADLVGSTGAQERMDPEAVRAENTRAYAVMREAVERHAGAVVKFVGDGMMAVFGVPEVREDDAGCAIAAALDLRSSFGAAMRIGINSGEVVVAPGDTDVVGDAVNVAARLEAEAPAGGILVGEETYRLTRDIGRYDDAAIVAVRGREVPVAARVLVGLAATAAPATSAFVGRERELAALVHAVGVADGTSRARLVTVLGSPGVGKSRLLAELRQSVGDSATVLAGRCDPTTAGSLDAFVDVVRGAVQTAGGAAQLPVDAGERARIEAVLAALEGSGPAASPQETFRAIRRVIQLAAAVRPILIVLDDVHWAEPVLLDLVEHLVEWLGDVPVVLAIAARPELRELRSTLVEIGARPSLVVALEGLAAEATAALAEELLGVGGLPDALVTRIVEATDGNPLFVRELLRMLVDDGVLRLDDGEWTLAVDAADIEVPSTISALLAARIERLPADERTVLERASVLGQDVIRGALIELAPGAVRSRLDVILEALRRKELLEPAGDYWIDEPLLRFHHVLIRDSAYRRVLKAARADLHERAARWVSRKTGDGEEHDELIGYHLEQSHRSRTDLGPLDEHGREVAAEAGACLGRAALRALDRDDLIAAAALAGRALACVPDDGPGRAELLLVRCESLLDTGNVTAARTALDDLRTVAADERLRAWAVAFGVQVDALGGSADLTAAEAAADEAARALSALGDSAGTAKAHRVRALVLARAGRIGDTEAALDLALTAARAAGDHRQISGVLAAAPLAALWGPSPVPRAGGRCLDVIRLLRITTGAREVEAVSMRCQAVLEALRGRVDPARAMLDRAREVLVDLGLRHGLLDLDLFTGHVELIAGDPSAAATALTHARDGYRATGRDADAAQAAALLARAELLRGDEDAALACAEEAARVGDAHRKTAVAWRAVVSEVRARRGEHDVAVDLARSAVAIAEGTDALIDHADALAALATVLSLAGDAGAAMEASARAAALYEQKGATALVRRGAPARGDDAGSIGVGRSLTEPRGAPATRERGARETRADALTRRIDAAIAGGRWDDFASAVDSCFVLEDRRSIATVRFQGAEQMVSVFPLFAGGVARSEVIATRGDNLTLVRTFAGSSDFQIEWLTVNVVGDNERLLRCVQFDPDDLAAAFAELERLAASGGEAAANRAVETANKIDRCTRERRWADLEQMWHPDFVIEDRRSSATLREDDRGGIMKSSVAVYDDIELVTRSRLLAVHGESRALFWTAQTNEQFSIEFLFLLDVDGAGRATRGILWDPDELTTALTELAVQRATDGPATGGPIRPTLASVSYEIRMDALAGRRHDLFAHMSHPEFVLDDRRHSVGNTTDASRTSEGADVMLGMGLAFSRREVLAIRGERLLLTRQDFTDGDNVIATVSVGQVDEFGRQLRTVSFDADDLEAATAELDRLAAEVGVVPHPAVPPNRAAVLGRVGIPIIVAGHWDELRGRMDPAFVQEDRQPVATVRVMGREDTIASCTVIAELGLQVDQEVVATRGDHLALVRQTVAGEGFTAETLAIFEYDRDDLAVRAVQFAADDLDAALAELNRLAARASEPPVTLGTWAAMVMSEYSRAGRWADLERLYNPAFVVEDRRHAVAGPDLDVARTVDAPDALAAVGLRYTRCEVLATQGELLVLTRDLFEGDGYVIETASVTQLDEWGRPVRSVGFDGCDRASARAELDRLAAEVGVVPYSKVPPNRAAYLSGVWSAFVVEGRTEEMRAMMRGDFRVEDRRPLARVRVLDRDALVESTRLARELSLEIRRELLATRCDRLFLLRQSVVAGGFADEMLILTEFDDGDLAAWSIQFGPDDLDAALAELDRLASAGAFDTTATRVVAALVGGVVAQDWAVLEALYANEFEYVDHRALAGGFRFGRGEQLEAQRAAATAAPFTAIDTRPVAVRGDRLALHRALVSSGDAEVDLIQLTLLDAGGRIRRLTTFDPRDLCSAMAELDELAAEGLAGSRVAPNRAVLRGHATTALLMRGRLDEYRACYREDYVQEDRRPIATDRYLDRDRAVASTSLVHELGLRLSVYEPVATRADNLALIRVAVGNDDFSDEMLIVAECDEDGRSVRSIQFEADGLDSALAELDRLAGEDTEHPIVAAMRLGAGLAATRDWDGYRRNMVPGCRYVYRGRRVAAARELDVEGIVATERVAVEELGMTMRVEGPIASRGDRLVLVRTWDTAPSGFTTGHLAVVHAADDGRFDHVVSFDDDDLDGAMAELDRLAGVDEGAAQDPDPANRAVRVFRAVADAIVESDWETVRRLSAPGYLCHAQRNGVHIDFDTESVITAFRDDPPQAIDVHVIDEREERAALIRLEVHSPSGFVTEDHYVIEIDEQGRLRRSFGFDIDLDAARHALDSVVNEEVHPAVRAFRTVNVALSNMDPDGVRTVLAPGFVCEERRQDVAILLGVDDIIADLSRNHPTDADLDVLDVRGERHALIRARYEVEDTDFVGEQLHVIEVDEGGRITRAFNFRDDALAEASATLGRLATPADNAAVRAHRVFGDCASRGDWEPLHDHLAPGLILEYEQKGTVIAFTLDEMAASSVEMSSFSTEVLETVGDHLALVRSRYEPVESGFALECLHLVEVDADGRIVRGVTFEPDALPRAVAELRASASENLAVRATRRVNALMTQGRWDEVRTALAPEFTTIDRRPGVRSPSLDRDTVVATMRDGAELGIGVVTGELIAVRGERLALYRNRLSGQSGFDVDSVLLTRCDSSGRPDLTVLFEPSDLTAATAELERLDAALRSDNDSVRAYRAFSEAQQRCQWDACRQMLAPGYLFRNRTGGIEVLLDGDGLMNSLTTGFDRMGAESIEVIECAGTGAALIRSTFQTTEHGFTYSYLHVAEVGDDGRFVESATFDAEALDEARAWLHRPPRENAATRLQQACTEWLLAGDFDAIGRVTGPAMHLEDRRALQAMTYEGDATVTLGEATVDVGYDRVDTHVLDVRGNDAALMRQTYTATDSGYRSDVLELLVLDEQGRGDQVVLFEPDAVLEAMAELDRLAGTS